MIINYTDSFVLQMQIATEMLRASIVDPTQQIRILSSLATAPAPIVSSSADATAAMCRRAALASLALATAAYVPTSKTEVEGILASIVPLYDVEIQYAADNGDIGSYTQLRQVRAAVVNDLRVRGANLPELIVINVLASRPSLVLAWSLYADATRETDLINRNPTVIHPLFMPLSFEALSS